jgi:hypothetical protein
MGSSRRAAIWAFYYVLRSSSSEESDDEIDLLIAATAMVNDPYLMSLHSGGSLNKRLPNVDRDQEAGHLRLYASAWLT